MESRVIDRRGAYVLIGSYVLALALTLLFSLLPDSLDPSAAIGIAIGLLMGPWGAVGSAAAWLTSRIVTGVCDAEALVYALVLLLVAYLPYRLWYSTLTWVRPKTPVLGTAHNMMKVFAVVTGSAVISVCLRHAVHAAFHGTSNMLVLDVDTLLLTLAPSYIATMAAIFVTGVLRVEHWTPQPQVISNRMPRTDPKVYDLSLLLSIPVALSSSLLGDLAWASVVAAIALVAFSVFKPQMTVRRWEVQGHGVKGTNLFKNQINDRIIILLCMFGLAAILLVCGTFVAGPLGNIPALENLASSSDGFLGQTSDELAGALSLLTYILIATLALFVVIIVILRFLENSVVTPIRAMSRVARDFIIADSEVSADEVAARCGAYADRDNEIGDLARSLGKLTRDVADYVHDIESLTRDKQAYRAELAIARQIQMELINRDFDSMEGTGVRISGVMDTAKSVGGDLYDFMELPRFRVAVVIGDVSGKGVPAALFMSRTKTLIEDHAGHGSDPATSFHEINNALARNNTQVLFVSCWMGIIDTRTGIVEFANAGHCPPLILRAATGEAEFVEMEPCPVLGVIPDTDYRVETLRLERGDRLLLYTDGVTEANSGYTEFFGSERLREVVEETASLTPNDQLRVIREDVRNFVGTNEQFDDITMLLVEFQGHSTATGLRAVDDTPSDPARADHVLIGGPPGVQLLQNRQGRHAEGRERVLHPLGVLAYDLPDDEPVRLQLPERDAEHAGRAVPGYLLEVVEADAAVGGDDPQDCDLVLPTEKPDGCGERGLTLGYRVHVPISRGPS